MIRSQPLSGFSYAKAADYATFAATLPPTGVTREQIGTDAADHPIYGMYVGSLTAKPVIYVQGGIHGAHEWRSPHWIRQFASYIATPPARVRQQVVALKQRVSFYFVPCLNPYGYENNSYTNANGVNLNRNSDRDWAAYDDSGDTGTKGGSAFSEPETQAMRDKVLALAPVMFVDCHTAGGLSGVTYEVEAQSREYDILLRDAAKAINLATGKAVSVTNTPHQPRSANWAAAQTARDGRGVIGVTIEPGDLESNTEQARLGMTALLLLCEYAVRWSRSHTLTKHGVA